MPPAVRRTGGMTALEDINRFFTISEMLVVSSNYWNVIHGSTPGEAQQDLEGQQIMRLLGKNMAWMLKSIAAGGQPQCHHHRRRQCKQSLFHFTLSLAKK